MTGRARRSRSRLAAGARGYTMVEVAIAMTLFAIGAAAAVAMERTSVQGDADARQQDVATSIAAEWVARLQKDALNWKILPNGTTTIAATTYLNSSYLTSQMCGAAATYNPKFVAPALNQTFSGNVDGRGFAYDLFGHDVADPTQAAYCVAISECFEDPAAVKLVQGTVMVFWPRKLSAPAPAGWCSASTSFQGNTFDPQVYRSMSVTVMLQGGGTQQ